MRRRTLRIGSRNQTHFVTGSLPSIGGAFGRFITSGNSGGFCVGSQPKNAGRIPRPASTKSSVEAGIGGKAW